MRVSFSRVALALGAVALIVGSAGPAQTAEPTKDIVTTAVQAGSFNTLSKALAAAGLGETLKGPGPFTVFAPTDEAFAKLPPGTLEALLADQAKLTKVLTYHVVPGTVMAADVVTMSSVKTVQGQSVTIDTRGGVKVDNANVVKTDILATNGVIHVIDAVILPQKRGGRAVPPGLAGGTAPAPDPTRLLPWAGIEAVAPRSFSSRVTCACTTIPPSPKPPQSANASFRCSSWTTRSSRAPMRGRTACSSSSSHWATSTSPFARSAAGWWCGAATRRARPSRSPEPPARKPSSRAPT
jgi:uncharacterized surface protein with fasciclin (FAS1) repeats